MATFKHIGNMIYIDDLEIPLNLFRALEPMYYTSPGVETLIYTNGTLKVRANGKTISVGGWPEGDRYISRKKDFETLLRLANKEDSEVANEVDSIARPESCREREYPQIRELVIALWERIVEKRDTAKSGIDALQQKREAIKDKYPLKETEDGSNQVEGRTETVLPKGTRRTRNRG